MVAAAAVKSTNVALKRNALRNSAAIVATAAANVKNVTVATPVTVATLAAKKK